MRDSPDFESDYIDGLDNPVVQELSDALRFYIDKTVIDIIDELDDSPVDCENDVARATELLLNISGHNEKNLNDSDLTLRILKTGQDRRIQEDPPFYIGLQSRHESYSSSESILHEIMSGKFIIFIFQIAENKPEYIFKGIYSWMLPVNDLRIIYSALQGTRAELYTDEFKHEVRGLKLNPSYVEKEVLLSFFNRIEDESRVEFYNSFENDIEYISDNDTDSINETEEEYYTYATVDLIRSIGEYCRDSIIEVVRLLPDMLNTVSNVYEDYRSDEYMKILCNMSLASFILNGSTEIKNLLKVCLVSSNVLKEMIHSCDRRIVYENAISPAFLSELTLNLDNYISTCSHLVDDATAALNEVGFIDFVSFFKDKYNWNNQQEERGMADRNRIAMYVKYVDILSNFGHLELFDSDEDYANALEHFSDRGIFMSESEVTPKRYRLLTYLNDKNNTQTTSEGNVFDKLFSEIKSNLLKECQFKVKSDTIDGILLLIRYSYASSMEWKEKIILNSTIAYMISPNRFVFNGALLLGDKDIFANLLFGCISTIGNSDLINKSYEMYVFLDQLESLELELHDTIVDRYGNTALFDMMSRQASQCTEKVVDWAYSLRVDRNRYFYYYYVSEGSALLKLTRMLDKNIGVDPKYKNRLCVHMCINDAQHAIVDEIEMKISNHTIDEVRQIRYENKSYLS